MFNILHRFSEILHFFDNFRVDFTQFEFKKVEIFNGDFFYRFL